LQLAAFNILLERSAINSFIWKLFCLDLWKLYR